MSLDSTSILRLFAGKLTFNAPRHLCKNGPASMRGFIDLIGEAHTLTVDVTAEQITLHFDLATLNAGGFHFMPRVPPARVTCSVQDIDAVLGRLANHLALARDLPVGTIAM